MVRVCTRSCGMSFTTSVSSAVVVSILVHVHALVGINVEGGFNLSCATRRGRNVIEVELTLKIVVLGHCTLALEHLDVDWLVGISCALRDGFHDFNGLFR